MKTRKLGTLEVSELGSGCMSISQVGDPAGKVIISCSLPMNANDTALAVAHTSSGAEVLAKKLRKADVISAFSTVPSEVLFDVFDAKKRRTRRRPSLMYCGDDHNQHEQTTGTLGDGPGGVPLQ